MVHDLCHGLHQASDVQVLLKKGEVTAVALIRTSTAVDNSCDTYQPVQLVTRRNMLNPLDTCIHYTTEGKVALAHLV